MWWSDIPGPGRWVLGRRLPCAGLRRGGAQARWWQDRGPEASRDGTGAWLDRPHDRLPAPQTVEHPRRDKRRGKHTAFVRRSEEGHPCIVLVVGAGPLDACCSCGGWPRGAGLVEGCSGAGAHVLRHAAHPAPCSCTWGDPYGGECTDTFELAGDTLTQARG